MFNRLNLNGTWQLSGEPEIGPIDADVPGEVYPALQTAGIIPADAEQVQWVEEKEWWYTVTFKLPEKFVKKKTVLKFDGLGAYASVLLNGREVGRTDDLFMPYTFDVGEAIKDGAQNVLSVRFDPAARVLEKQACGCYSGLDRVHRLAGLGIWRDANLVSYDQLTISDVYVQPVRRGNDADAWIYITIDNFTGEDVEAQFVVIVAKDENREKTEFTEIIPAGGDVVEAVIRIEDPELWYPKGMGDQPLYVALVGLSADGDIQDVREEFFGVRTVQLEEEALTLRINGDAAICKSSEWAPVDPFSSRVTPQQYEEQLKKLADDNINMLRVQGGGMYEDPAFYRLCDQLGIMICQNLALPRAGHLKAEQVEQAVVALRNYPSVVIWCGGGEKMKSTIPETVAKLDGTRPYSSECSC